MNNLISRDELFKAKVAHENKAIAIYNKVLKRVHIRIRHSANLNQGRTECVYLIPDFMLGVPTYNVKDCIVFVITSLCKNGFRVNYTHPNLLHISWKHWEKDYEVSKQYIQTEQNQLVMNKQEEKRRVMIENQRREQARHNVAVRHLNLYNQHGPPRQNGSARTVTINRDNRPADMNQSVNNFVKSVEMEPKPKQDGGDGGFYELDQIKKIQYLMNN
jgi:hypothetical protein